MTQACPATVGQSLDEIETPALLVDLDAYERNLKRMASALEGRAVRLRPHAKTHKSPEIAVQQMAHGAVGVCCQKVGEAEVLVAGGVPDVMVSNQVVGGSKIARLAALAGQARLAVCVDDGRNVAELSAAATAVGAAGVTLGVLVEIEVGCERCGVAPGEPARVLAAQVAESPGLEFVGLQAYHGNAQHIRTVEERRAAVRRAADLAAETAELLARAGLACPVISGGGTGTLPFDLEAGVLTELQAGSYIFLDADYARNETAETLPGGGFEHSLFVLTTVMSLPRPGRAVTDAGLKALAFDSGPPAVWRREGVRYTGPSDEHGTLEAAKDASLGYGEKLLLVPGHCDPTVNLYDWYVGIRSKRVERVWPVAARGAVA
jgi:D-serine deaminase-like pyridoxal phosphate-dependent protein